MKILQKKRIGRCPLRSKNITPCQWTDERRSHQPDNCGGECSLRKSNRHYRLREPERQDAQKGCKPSEGCVVLPPEPTQHTEEQAKPEGQGAEKSNGNFGFHVFMAVDDLYFFLISKSGKRIRVRRQIMLGRSQFLRHVFKQMHCLGKSIFLLNPMHNVQIFLFAPDAVLSFASTNDTFHRTGH
ncbi:MAG: hypothetical protein ACKVUS_05060 [Saprospiraceae bacterium]